MFSCIFTRFIFNFYEFCLQFSDPVPLGAERQEKLPTRQLSQLEACAQRLSDHVHCAEDRENGQVHG